MIGLHTMTRLERLRTRWVARGSPPLYRAHGHAWLHAGIDLVQFSSLRVAR